MDASVLCGFDVMLHVADEQRLVRFQRILFQDVMNLFAFVPHVDVRFIKKFCESGRSALDRKMIAMDGAQQEGPDFFGPAEFQEDASMGQVTDRILDLLETAVKPGLQLGQGDVGDKALVKAREGKTKFGAKLFQSDFGALGLRE